MRSLLPVAALLAAGCGGGPSASAPAPDTATTLAVGAVQGDGDTSPYVGRVVTVSGVVTGDFQSGDGDSDNDLGGFYILGLPDAKLDSSDGIFVYDRNTSLGDVRVGDSVTVTGEVVEFYGETQIHPRELSITGRAAVEPVRLQRGAALTTNSDGELIDDLERYEGMLVQVDEPMTVSDTSSIDRFGDVLLVAGDRAFIYTSREAPSVSAYREHLEDLARRSLVLDDGRRAADVRPVRYFDRDAPLRVGDRVAGLTGVLRYARGSGGGGTETWRLMPTEAPVFTRANPRPAPPKPGGSLRVAGINLMQFFTTIDDGTPRCGPARDSNCRGADTAAEFDRQLDKAVTMLAALDADIVGLAEIENNARASLEALVDGLAARGRDYAFVDTGTLGSDAIKVGLIYKPASVAAQGTFAVLDASVDRRFNDRKNRPVLAQTFRQQSDGALLTVAVNHLKSKGSDCNELGDPDAGDGQGNCNLTRTRAAEAMADWLAGDPTGSGDPDVLIVGDLNAYAKEDPVLALESAGFTNLSAGSNGDPAYSFVFRGQSGALDHAFASESLTKQVTGALDWHINADEPRMTDYNLDGNRDASWFDAETPYRSADHDPVVIGLQLTSP